MSNKYVHPQLLKGTTVSIEGKNEVTGEKGQIARCAVACLWLDIKRIDRVQFPALVFPLEDFNEVIMYIEFRNGAALYLLDSYDEVLAAWELYLNAASLSNKSILSN